MEYHTVEEVKEAIATYVDEYYNERPHQALGYRIPSNVYHEAI